MSLWLYPISESADREFLLNDGSLIKVSVKSFEQLVKNRKLAEDDRWYVTQNFNRVDIGDEIYIYTGDESLGIIGYAVVQDKGGHNRDTWQLNLDIDLDKCNLLIQNPVPAEIVRPWILPSRIKTVNNLDHVKAELESLLPWSSSIAIDIEDPSPPERKTTETTRVIRDTKISKGLKKLYNNRCQICGTVIELFNRDYSETHHLRPLGSEHEGPDIKQNIIVVCPNHHAQLDYRALGIKPSTLEIVHRNGQKLGKLRVRKKHELGRNFLKYHFKKYLL